MKYRFILLFILSFPLSIHGQQKPSMRDTDKVRIKEAININKKYSNKIWKGLAEIPFVLLLVTDSTEFLINHPKPTEDFQFLENDELLGTSIYFRNRQFNPGFLATFPAVGGIPTIVVGTPENTGKHSTAWIITVLHEHFHQYQMSDPDYYPATNKLDLAGDDPNMWMLNYPFPYQEDQIALQYEKYTVALATCIRNIDTEKFDQNFSSYKQERMKLKKLVGEKDYRYFSFQIWQEGVSRYTEYAILRKLDKYKPSAACKALPDFVPFQTLKSDLFNSQLDRITNFKLPDRKRECFYALGFGEGLLLDKLNPKWRKQYFSKKFFIEKYADEFD